MKKSWIRSLLIVVCMALMIGYAGTATAGKKERGWLYFDTLGGFYQSEWFYVKDTVPKNLLIQCEGKTTLFNWDRGCEDCEKANVKFVSGSEHLKEAVKIRSAEDGNKFFYVDNDVLTEPGEAVFRLSAESKHFQWSDDYYLKVIDYNEYPLLDVKTKEPVLEVSVRNCFERKDVLAEIADVHLCEIHEKLKDQIPIDRFSFMENADPFHFSIPYYILFISKHDGYWDEIDWDLYHPEYYEVEDYGACRVEDASYKWGNVELKVPYLYIQTETGIAGKGKVRPGEIAIYYLDKAESKVSWTMEGEHAQFEPYVNNLVYWFRKPKDNEKGYMIEFRVNADRTYSCVNNSRIQSELEYCNKKLNKNGFGMTVLTIDEDAEYGSEIILSATDEQGNQFSKIVTVGSMFDEKDLVRVDAPEKNNGYSFSYPRKGFYNDGSNENCGWDVKIYGASKSIYGALYEDPDRARTYLQEIFENYEKGDNFKHKWIAIENHPAYIGLFSKEDSTWGYLQYVRNSSVFVLFLSSNDSDNPVGFYDFETLAKHISYDETAAPFTVADAKLSITAKGDPKTVTAGRNLTFNYTFANPEKVSKKNKNDTVVWSVGNADTGESVEGVSIDARGQLKVDKRLAAPVDLQVKAASELFGTSTTYNITAMPAVSKITLDPAEVFFYNGMEDIQTVKASLEPATVPPVGLTWTAVKNGIVEITPVEDGMVSIKPLAAGKTDIAVKEPGGKNARLTVNVVAPVESVELKANGAATAGGKVKIAATLAPKNVGNKAVQWSVDVGEDIATINEKGQLTISKTAPSGTKITVTCTALGAPSPVVGMLVVEVP